MKIYELTDNEENVFGKKAKVIGYFTTLEKAKEAKNNVEKYNENETNADVVKHFLNMRFNKFSENLMKNKKGIFNKDAIRDEFKKSLTPEYAKIFDMKINETFNLPFNIVEIELDAFVPYNISEFGEIQPITMNISELKELL